MSGQDFSRTEVGGFTATEKTQTQESDRRKLSNRYHKDGYDVESQQPNNPPAPFPGATYGFNPSDQPTQPPRRVSSTISLRKQQSTSSLRDNNDDDNTTNHARGDSTAPPQTTEGGDQQNPDNESQAEELAWNPSHPCFPHPNSHVPLSSPEYNTTRIIRIKRDWMAHGDLAPSYSNIYPEILDPLLPESEFRFLVTHINRAVQEAFDPFSTWNWIDGLLGLATGWLWEDFRPGGIKGKLKGLEFWIDQWNQRVGSRDGVRVIPLRRTGYMCLDIEIPDPQVRVVDPDIELDGDADRDADGNYRAGQGHPLQLPMHVRDIRRGTVTTATETDSRV